MPDYDYQLRELKTKIQQASARAARAQVEKDNATAAVDRARKALLDEFGVSTPEEAKAKLEALEAALEANLTAAREALAEALG